MRKGVCGGGDGGGGGKVSAIAHVLTEVDRSPSKLVLGPVGF